MTCSELPSDVLFALCEEMKPAVHGGRWVTGEEFSALIRKLNTAIALSEEVEEEKRILERQARLGVLRRPGLAVVGDNVVAFPAHPSGRGAPA